MCDGKLYRKKKNSTNLWITIQSQGGCGGYDWSELKDIIIPKGHHLTPTMNLWQKFKFIGFDWTRKIPSTDHQSSSGQQKEIKSITIEKETEKPEKWDRFVRNSGLSEWAKIFCLYWFRCEHSNRHHMSDSWNKVNLQSTMFHIKEIFSHFMLYRKSDELLRVLISNRLDIVSSLSGKLDRFFIDDKTFITSYKIQ